MLQVDFRVSAMHADPRSRSGIVCQLLLLTPSSTKSESPSGCDSCSDAGLTRVPAITSALRIQFLRNWLSHTRSIHKFLVTCIAFDKPMSEHGTTEST